MERDFSNKMSQQGLCFPVLMILFFYIPDIVSGQIGVNCGSGAVVGQPYNMECTNIPEILNNGINVFLEGEDNSIITCFPSKTCISRDDSRYSVMTPHNESLFFTILDVTQDDIGKKIYCANETKVNPTSDPSCPLEPKQTTAATTASTEVTECVGCLSGGTIAGIVIGVIAACGAVIIIIIVVIKKKSGSERASL